MDSHLAIWASNSAATFGWQCGTRWIDWFCGLPLEAHIAATGAPFAIDGPSGPDAPVGTPADLTDESRTRRQFPRLTAYLDNNPWIERPGERGAS